MMNTTEDRINNLRIRSNDIGSTPTRLMKTVVKTANPEATSSPKHVASQNSDSHVYIRSKKHGWIPASLVSTEGNVATVISQKYNNEEEMLNYVPQNNRGRSSQKSKVKTVKLTEYENEILPLQNVDDGGKLRDYEDMVNLPYLHEAAILYNLKYRHYKEKPYTRTGDVVIAVNPYKWYVDLYTEKKRTFYARTLVWEKSESDPRDGVEPHVYEVSALSFKGMAYENENQSILVSGESGAGKTETVKICMDHIASVQRGAGEGGHLSDEKSQIVQRILDSNPLLEAFGNAKTRRNDNSSRFGKFIQLQFDKGNKKPGTASLAGSKCEVYLLEKNRVVSHDSEERSFHIFYQLVAAPENEKVKIWDGLSNTNNESFSYVGYTSTDTIEDICDHDRFALTKETLELVGIKGAQFKALMQVMCIVLQLGNIVFSQDGDDCDRSVVSSPSELKGLSELMGISGDDLAMAFTERTMQTNGEVYKVPLNQETAKDSCNAFAKEIYGRVFLWLMDSINKATCAEDNYQDGAALGGFSTIGLLDIFGFEHFEVNRFDQLCINYANEKLQQKFTEDIFRSVEVEYKAEGIPLAEIKYDDNTDVLDLIEGRTGLLAMLNEECVRPKGNASGFVFKAIQQNRRSPCLIEDKHDRMNFGIRHFAGKVMYSAEDFTTSNMDTLPCDLMDCGTKCSNNSIIASLFKDDQAVTVKKSKTRASGGKRSKSSIVAPTVWTKYKKQLSELMVNLRKTQTRYIRCIKPNTVKKPIIMENNVTIEQLRSAGIVAGVTIARAAFPNRLPNNVVYRRYNSMWDRKKYPSRQSSSNSKADKLKEDCSAMLTCALKSKETTDFDDRVVKAFVVGKTRTYFRSGALEYLESKRLKGLDTQAVTIQRHARGWLARKRIQDALLAKKKKRELKKKAALEEKARLERLAKEEKERQRQRDEKVQELQHHIDDLKNRIRQEDKHKASAIRAADERKQHARKLQQEYQRKIDQNNNDTKALVDMYTAKIEANRMNMKVLKQEQKEVKKEFDKTSKLFKKLSNNNQKLNDWQERNSTTLEDTAPSTINAANTNNQLQDTIDQDMEDHRVLKSSVREKQEEYMGTAKQRLETQKALRIILTLIQDRCKDSKIVDDAQNIAYECENEWKARMNALEEKFG